MVIQVVKIPESEIIEVPTSTVQNKPPRKATTVAKVKAARAKLNSSVQASDVELFSIAGMSTVSRKVLGVLVVWSERIFGEIHFNLLQ